MALRILGQAAPVADTPTDVYTVPVDTTAVVSTMTLTNRSSNGTTVRAWARPGGAAAADAQAFLWDAPVGPFEALFLTVGLTLGAGDVITIETPGGGLSTALFGQEV